MPSLIGLTSLLCSVRGTGNRTARGPIRGPAFVRREVTRPKSAQTCSSATRGSGRPDYLSEIWSVSGSALVSGDRGYAQVIDAEEISSLAFSR
jgi:hypothetical protein